ncbi:hypothetical protein FSP39_021173 [Pinctada imbricata]|uniref:Uncharacterized protein n=1 Tax=Pinctada imbricata TaxID=66713 RepID=A0AA89BMW6_PINIB|nr:hypothetical protein FSP39_021173 [Pinctada imbricata]
MESVKYFIKAAFRAAIIVPLTAGNSVNPHNPQETDGSLASMVTIACLTAITFVIIGIYGGKQTKVTEAHLVIWSLVVAMIILALICVIVISVVAYRHRAEWFVRQTESIRKGSLKLKIMFLWLFGFGIILETTLDLAINVDCIRQDKTVDHYTYRIASIASHLLSIVYYCLQMGFISYFIGYKFEGYIRINYGILIILLANLIHWFNSVVSEANDTYYRHNHTDITGSDCHSPDSDAPRRHPGFTLYRYAENDTYDDACYWNSRIECFLEQLLPYLLPARIEYFLLATGFILGMWPSVKHDENHTAEGK